MDPYAHDWLVIIALCCLWALAWIAYGPYAEQKRKK